MSSMPSTISDRDKRSIARAMRTKSRAPTQKAPADFDEVKRRFIRQNRELAKNNSSQSLRIRTLELEVSKLLGDNLDLREQILGLQKELQSAKKQATGEAIQRVKDDLRTKLAELNGIVDSLEDNENEADYGKPQVEKERLLSPSQRQYRERQPLAELMQESVMPTITEDKQYPRRTLDGDEIRAVRLSDQSGASGSPDLGPPPVAHFEFTSSSQESAESRSPAPASPKGVEEDLLPSVNLETRRKRKDGNSKIEIRRHSILAQSPAKAENDSATTMLRTGAKRKLADRDFDKPIKPPSQDDFSFSRKPSVDRSSSEEERVKTEKHAPESAMEQRESLVLEPSKPARRVLGEKSVNMSPRKVSTRGAKPSKDDLKKSDLSKINSSKDRPPTRGRRISSLPTLAPLGNTDIELPPPEPSTTEQLRPKTPAEPDVLSPASDSPIGGQARDTPPPLNLSSSSNTTEGGQRPSRRARSSVNYAEPSLIAKMRRPDKQMVDAISGLQNPRQVMNPSGARKSSGPSSVLHTVSIKQEPVDDDSAWKGISHSSNRRETGSPLRGKSTDNHPPPMEEPEPMLETKETARPSSTLPSVVASSRRRRESDNRSSSQPLSMTVEEAARKMEEMELYDFKDSSSPFTEDVKPADSTKVSHRRHSSMPKEPAIVNSRRGTLGSASTDRAATRRRSMML